VTNGTSLPVRKRGTLVDEVPLVRVHARAVHRVDVLAPELVGEDAHAVVQRLEPVVPLEAVGERVPVVVLEVGPEALDGEHLLHGVCAFHRVAHPREHLRARDDVVAAVTAVQELAARVEDGEVERRPRPHFRMSDSATRLRLRESSAPRYHTGPDAVRSGGGRRRRRRRSSVGGSC
jgi:hypothetical protein